MSKKARLIMYPMLAVVIAFFVYVQFVYVPQEKAKLAELKANDAQVEQVEATDAKVEVQTNDAK